MQKYPPAAVTAIWSLLCITLGASMAYYAEKHDDHLPPPRSSAPAPPKRSHLKPGRIMTITAYDAGACCCAPYADGLTASGVPAVGRIVAGPPSMPFGTKLWIEGQGEYVVQDRGGTITEGRLDILFATHEDAKQWGVQELMVWEVE